MANFLFTVFIISLAVLSCASVVLPPCFFCEKYYHRHSDGTCPHDVEGCTSCINGNVIDVDKLDSCLDLNVTLKPPKETRVALDGVVIIPCVLTAKVECAWLHHGQAVDLTSHSRYQLKTQTEAYTTDCSLVIQRASLEDEGFWTCSNTPTAHQFNSNFTIAETTRVHVDQPSVIVVEQPISFSPLEIFFIVIGALLAVAIPSGIAFAIYRCYNRNSNGSISSEMNNATYTTMPSSPTEPDPKAFKYGLKWTPDR